MNKFKFYFILSIATISLFSCSKNDSPDPVPPLAYGVQYTNDIATIEEYLKTYYISVVDHPGFPDDQDVTITKIPEGGTQKSIWDQTTYELKSKDVKLHDITYKLYYLVLRPGVGESPCNADGVLPSYKGEYLEQIVTSGVATLTATQFEEVKHPQQIMSLLNTIKGWGETFPLFKTGTYSSNDDGTVTYNDFGAGVMFLPSGLGYFEKGNGEIPPYAPLVFSFKLYEIERLDFDGDGIPSYLEDLDGDGFMRSFATGVVNPDDTDGDGIPNFMDVDDDGDNYTTKLEITKPAGSPGPSKYYPFNHFLVADDSSTPEDESMTKSEPKGIPDASGDGTSLTRLRRHLDPNAKPPYPTY